MNTIAAGNNYNFQSTSAALKYQESWRLLDQAVARWVVAHGGSNLLAEVAAWASYAEGQGDSALPLTAENGRHGMRQLSEQERTLLSQQPMLNCVSSDESMMVIKEPFVLQYGNFYLRKNFMHEVAVADAILQRRKCREVPALPMQEVDLDQLFDNKRDSQVQLQREAVSQCLGKRFFVLTGGPGTGKTTTVIRMLMALSRNFSATKNKCPIIRISAPTGKAAQRLKDSLTIGGLLMRESGLDSAWFEPLDSALAAQSSTLHRLLGSRGQQGGFAHHAGNQVPADIVIIDEASMVDLAMLRALLNALSSETILILVGDADQLTSVATGSAFQDIVAVLEAEKSDDIVRLHQSFRANQTLVDINDAVRDGDLDSFQAAWQLSKDKAILFPVVSRETLQARLRVWCRQLKESLMDAGAFERKSNSPKQVKVLLDHLKKMQILCGLREGVFGAEWVAGFIEAQLRQDLPEYKDKLWYPGRAVMITVNDYSNDLFNGDVGLCLSDQHGNLQVWFEGSSLASGSIVDDIDEPTLRSFSSGSLPSYQCAFAVTVHKSQGSEYERVAVLLPPEPDNAILSRQLLYTALTRAKLKVELWCTEEALRVTLATNLKRCASLRERLQQVVD